MNRYQATMLRINKGERILVDGATGTELERRGVPQVENGWNGSSALSHPLVVRDVHEDYIRCGAKMVISNTFATSRHVTRGAGMENHFEFLNRRGIELAIAARRQADTPLVLVAGGISHWTFTGEPPSLEELHANIVEQAQIMADAGADLLVIEMATDIERLKVTVDAAQQSALPVWVGLSGELNGQGEATLRGGQSLSDALTALRDRHVPLVSLMHTEVDHVDSCLDVVQAEWEGPIGVYAHSGRYANPHWEFDNTIPPQDYAVASRGWMERGVQLIGGCCGIGPDHIAAIAETI